MANQHSDQVNAGTLPVSGWRRAARWLVVSVFYFALAVVQTSPLVTRLAAVLPHDLGDPVLNTWILWWNAQAVPFTARWWSGPIFWPSRDTLTFSETLLGLYPLTTPMQWLGGTAVTV